MFPFETYGYVLLCVAGSVFFPGLLLLLQYFWFNVETGLLVRKRYNFSIKDCTDISVKLVSGFQAILASIVGVFVCSSCSQNVLHCSHPLTLLYAWFGIPYFIYDTFAMFYASRKASTTHEDCTNTSIFMEFCTFLKKSPVIVVHHIVLAPVGFFLLVYCRDGVRNGDFFMGIVYLMEVSTPFVSMRFILSKFRMKSSCLYALNGVLMLTLFPLFRIISSFYTVQLFATQNDMGYFEVLWTMPFGWKVVCVSAVAPQVYWYYLMWNGLIKMLTSRSSSKTR